MGSYIRARRLSKAAVALRLTNRPILDIALEYHFDSQQTFTRAFKKQFSQSPGRYRRSSDWTAYGLLLPIHPGDLTLPKSIFMTFPETVLTGQTQSYTCEPNCSPVIRMKWGPISGGLQTDPLYGLWAASGPVWTWKGQQTGNFVYHFGFILRTDAAFTFNTNLSSGSRSLCALHLWNDVQKSSEIHSFRFWTMYDCISTDVQERLWYWEIYQ